MRQERKQSIYDGGGFKNQTHHPSRGFELGMLSSPSQGKGRRHVSFPLFLK